MFVIQKHVSMLNGCCFELEEKKMKRMLAIVLVLCMALSRYKIHTEVHIYPEGLHGAALCNEQCAGVINPQYDLPELQGWPELAVKFLKKYMK